MGVVVPTVYCAYNYYNVRLHVKVISGKCIHASIIAPGLPHNAMLGMVYARYRINCLEE